MKNLSILFTFCVALFFAVFFTSCKEEITPERQEASSIQKSTAGSPASALNDEVVVKAGVAFDDFQSVYNSEVNKGYRLISIDAFIHRAGIANDSYNTINFNLIFEKNPNDILTLAYPSLTGAVYQNTYTQLKAQGFKLIHIESYVKDGAVRYAPIFAMIAGPSFLGFHGLSPAQYQEKFNTYTDLGYRLVNRSIVELNGNQYFTVLFDKKNVGAWVAKSGLDLNQTQTMMEQNHDAGRILSYLDISQSTSSDFTYAPIFNSENNTGWYALNKLTKAQLLAEIAEAHSKGYKTNVVVAYDIFQLINGNETYAIRYAGSWVKD